MIRDFKFPTQITPDLLDGYLAAGWYRMRQSLFTTDFVEWNGKCYKAIWLRNRLENYKPSSTFKKLEKRNRNFRTEIIRYHYSKEYEALFQKYNSSLPPGRSDTLQEFLFDESSKNIFNSVVLNIFDSDKLIGAGIFDTGHKSAAGISSFYDPCYKKYSIGRYLIYKKIEYCQKYGYDFFYPGYFVPGIKAFDYKLELGKESLEFYCLEMQQWKLIRHLSNADKILS